MKRRTTEEIIKIAETFQYLKTLKEQLLYLSLFSDLFYLSLDGDAQNITVTDEYCDNIDWTNFNNEIDLMELKLHDKWFGNAGGVVELLNDVLGVNAGGC